MICTDTISTGLSQNNNERSTIHRIATYTIRGVTMTKQLDRNPQWHEKRMCTPNQGIGRFIELQCGIAGTCSSRVGKVGGGPDPLLIAQRVLAVGLPIDF